MNNRHHIVTIANNFIRSDFGDCFKHSYLEMYCKIPKTILSKVRQRHRDLSYQHSCQLLIYLIKNNIQFPSLSIIIDTDGNETLSIVYK